MRLDYELLTRQLAMRDGAAIVGLGSTLSWENWTLENLLAERPDKWSLSFLASSEGLPVAYAIASRRDEAVHLHHLIVGPDCRGLGIGSELLRRLVSKAREMGLARLTLKVHEHNQRAVAFYRKHGFDIVGHAEPDLLWMAAQIDTIPNDTV